MHGYASCTEVHRKSFKYIGTPRIWLSTSLRRSIQRQNNNSRTSPVIYAQAHVLYRMHGYKIKKKFVSRYQNPKPRSLHRVQRAFIRTPINYRVPDDVYDIRCVCGSNTDDRKKSCSYRPRIGYTPRDLGISELTYFCEKMEKKKINHWSVR